MSSTVLILFILFQVKHFLCDFPLQTSYMLGKGKGGLAWILPLATHCAVHSIFTLGIILFFKSEFYWIAGLEFLCHFVIDRMKVSYKLPVGVWDSKDKGKNLQKYYVAFGMDQLAHAMTYVWMIQAMEAV